VRILNGFRWLRMGVDDSHVDNLSNPITEVFFSVAEY
jgi:hypothetical protein